MTVSSGGPPGHMSEPGPSVFRLYPVATLILAMVLLFGIAAGVYLMWPASLFWVEIGLGVIAPIVAEVIGQVCGDRRQ
mgnify:CR=1 FL=1